MIAGPNLYMMNDAGFAQCLDVKTGKEHWRENLGKSWSSMVCADNRLYNIDLKGETFVFEAGSQFKLLARNNLRETTRASLAFSDGQIFIRTYQHLYCIGVKK